MKPKKINCLTLKGLMVANQKSMQDLIKVTGKCHTSISSKINGHTEWTIGEALKVAKLFNLNLNQVFPEIFLTYELPKGNISA